MTFLPIAERELRIAARKRGTYWGRLIPAMLALMIWCMVAALPFAGIWRTPGEFQFLVLKWVAFFYACATGLFVTADSLSEEKREGTLGLLFLTDLRGYDVVAGKLLSHSVPAFYGLLAAFPILAIPLLAGGLTGSEFWRTMFTLANTMFLSLAVGLFVSSVSRNAIRALNGTLLLTLALLVGLPFLDATVVSSRGGQFERVFSIASPGHLFASISAYRVKGFWPELGVQHLLGWGFLAAACVITPRAWQEKSRTFKPTRQSTTSASRRGWGARRALLNRQPISWLAARDRSLSRLIWSVTILLAVLYGLSIGNRQNSISVVVTFGPIVGLINFVVTVWTDAQACRFFSEGRRNGALELILVTPISPAEIVAGQWAALKKLIVWPTVALTLVYLVGGVLQTEISAMGGWRNAAQFQGVNMLDGAVSRIANVAAVAWFGMWLGLTERKASTATVKTFVYVIVLPALGITFSRFVPLTLVALAHGGSAWWVSAIFGMSLTVAKDAAFIIMARRNLLRDFRAAVARDGRVPGQPTLPPWAVAIQRRIQTAPPVIR